MPFHDFSIAYLPRLHVVRLKGGDSVGARGRQGAAAHQGCLRLRYQLLGHGQHLQLGSQ